MPYYEYRCPENGRTVEVRHSMSRKLETWADVCEAGEVDPGGTDPGAPVERLMSAPVPITSRNAPSAPAAPCGASCGCYPEA